MSPAVSSISVVTKTSFLFGFIIARGKLYPFYVILYQHYDLDESTPNKIILWSFENS